MNLYVSKDGTVEADGSIKKPFSSISECLKVAQPGDCIILRKGVYTLPSSLVLRNLKGKLTITAYKDEVVEITAGLHLTECDFEPVSEEDSLLYSFKNKEIIQCDLKKFGIKETVGEQYILGSHTTADFYPEYAGSLPCGLFINDKKAEIVSYPKKKSLKIEKILKEGTNVSLLLPEKKKAERIKLFKDKKLTFDCAVIKTDESTSERLSHWKNKEDIWVDGAFHYDWAPETIPCNILADSSVEMRVANYYGINKSDETRFRFINCPDELSDEDEYYIDKRKKLLYLIPSKKMFSAILVYKSFDLCRVECNDITFKNIIFSGTCGNGVTVKGNNVKFIGCTFCNLFGDALFIEGDNNVVRNCEFFNIGKNGVLLSGGDRSTLKQSRTRVFNNIFHEIGQVVTTYCCAIRIDDGVGFKVDHNVIYNVPHTAIMFFNGNDNIIEYNDIKNACYSSMDAGVIYTGFDWAAYGNVVRYNYIHDIQVENQFAIGPVGIYLDDGASGIKVYGNVISNIPHGYGVLWGGGRANKVENNIINNVCLPLHVDNRMRVGYMYLHELERKYEYGGNFWQHMVDTGNERNVFKTLDVVPWQSGVWQKKYKPLRSLTLDAKYWDTVKFPINPALSTIKNNICYWSDCTDSSLFRFESGVVRDGIGEYIWESEKWIDICDNFGAPIKECAVKENFTIPEEAAALKFAKGFQKIPFEKIGKHNKFEVKS